MQELISILKKETYSDISEDHYIIEKILPLVLNNLIDELFLQANDCIDDENFSEALLFYDLILKEDSKNIHALIDRGTTLQNLGQIKSAIISYDEALSISPDNTDALINKGSAFHLDKKYTDAIHCYDVVLRIDKKHPMALAYKGLSLAELGQLTEAIDYFKNALSIDKHYHLAQISRDTAQELLKSIQEKNI